MDEIDIYERLNDISELELTPFDYGEDSERSRLIAEHKLWLKTIRHERPNPSVPFKIGVYIRYFNQTKYSDYLSYHKKNYTDTIALCPKWDLVDFYIDEGASPPNIESAPGLVRLLEDCFAGKVDLIITQKVSNISKKPQEMTILARLLATQKKPIGMYFVDEDIFTLASYYQADMRDTGFFPSGDWKQLPDDELDDQRLMLND